MDDLRSKADAPLVVDLPVIRHICEPKALRYRDKPAFAVIAEHKKSCVRSNKVVTFK